MAFETLTKSLTEAGFAPEVVTQLVSNEKAAQTLQSWQEGGLRQSDYDRKMNAGKAEIEAKQAALREDMAAFETQKQAINKQYMDGLKSREQAETALASIRARAKTAADVYGVPLDKELFEGISLTETKTTTTETTHQPTDYEKRLGQVESLVPSVVDYATQMLDISRQHAELFPDKPLVFKELLEKAKTQRRPITDVWDDEFGATAKREDLKAEKYRAEGAARATEELEKKYSGQTVNGFRTDLPTSPIFSLAQQTNKGFSAPKDRAANAAESINNAIAALASGKYRPQARQAEK